MTRRGDEELPAIQACYELLLWIVPVLDRLPRNRKFTLGDRIESRLIDALSLLVAASYSRTKSERLSEANVRLQEVRYLVRLAKDLEAMSFKSYQRASEQLVTLGRMVGAWLKQQGAG